MPLTKEERHALATRVRLGDRVDPPAGIDCEGLDWLHIAYAGGLAGRVDFYVLGVHVGHLINASQHYSIPVVWADGTTIPDTTTSGNAMWDDEVLAYLEKE